MQTNTIAALTKLGFSPSEIDTLARIQRTFHRWDEQECGDSNAHCSWAIERDEKTHVPYHVVYPHTGASYRTKIRDREAAANRKLERLMKNHPRLWAYHQGDCRGCALYVGRKAHLKGRTLDSCYNIGIAVC